MHTSYAVYAFNQENTVEIGFKTRLLRSSQWLFEMLLICTNFEIELIFPSAGIGTEKVQKGLTL